MLRVTVAVPALVTDVAWWRRWWWSVIGLRLFFALFLWSCAKTRRTNQTNERKKRYVLHWSMGCWWGRCWCPKTYSPKNNSSTTTLLKSQTHYAFYSLVLYCCFQHWFNWNPSSIYPSIHHSHPYPYPSTTSNVKWLWRQKKISAKTISSKLNKTHPMLHRLGHI